MIFSRFLLFTIIALFSSALPSISERSNALSLDIVQRSPIDPGQTLEKRKGGGGGGKGGGGGGGSSSGGKGGGTSSGGGGGGTRSPSSGVTPSYGGGRYYGGGSSSAYRAGGLSPSGIRPLGLLPIAGIGFFAGLWLYPVFFYPYSHTHSYYNTTTNRNDTAPVLCLCQQYSDCGCDDDGNSTFLDSVLVNGRAANSSLVQINPVNGTTTIVLNGTLPNGTVLDSGAMAMGVNPIMSTVSWLLLFGTAAFFAL